MVVDVFDIVTAVVEVGLTVDACVLELDELGVAVVVVVDEDVEEIANVVVADVVVVVAAVVIED